ncbi:hypothetical protein [Streptomyces venezuelae]|uniref:hypothetical protein n=1 Tax=Streptomyces venezuelae TaxID=54571 RepID=UPI00278BF905|nr:hypothetical protein [Streptomyces venezuelae]
MDAAAVAAAFEDARFNARQNSRLEDLADDVGGWAELAEGERLDQLLASAPSGIVYDPDTDAVVQTELAAEAEAAADREAAVRGAADHGPRRPGVRGPARHHRTRSRR